MLSCFSLPVILRHSLQCSFFMGFLPALAHSNLVCLLLLFRISAWTALFMIPLPGSFFRYILFLILMALFIASVTHALGSPILLVRSLLISCGVCSFLATSSAFCQHFTRASAAAHSFGTPVQTSSIVGAHRPTPLAAISSAAVVFLGLTGRAHRFNLCSSSQIAACASSVLSFLQWNTSILLASFLWQVVPPDYV